MGSVSCSAVVMLILLCRQFLTESTLSYFVCCVCIHNLCICVNCTIIVPWRLPDIFSFSWLTNVLCILDEGSVVL